jgi:hypothetical protein
MIQDVSYKGEWSLPGNSEKYSGILTFNPNTGAELEIIGRFRYYLTPSSIDVIHGKTTSGWITLFDTRHHTGHTSHVTNTNVTIYKPSMIFEGHRFESKDVPSFRSVNFSLFNLLEWLDQKHIQENRNKVKYSLEFSNPDSLNFKCYDGCNGKIETILNGKYLNELYKIEISQESKITLQYDTPKHYTDILNDIFVMVRFLTLCTYEQSYPLNIEFYDDDLTDEFIQDYLGKSVCKPIKCIYQNSFYKPTYQTRKWHQHLLRYELIVKQFQRIVELWFKQSKDLAQPVNLLLQSFIAKYDFTIENFMDIVKALELFHRLNFPNNVLPKESFEDRKKKFFSIDLSQEELSWIQQKLQFANEPSLKNRLEELIFNYSFPYFEERVPDKKSFCRKATDCRNYYTHFNSGLNSRVLRGKELFDLTENLKLLLLSAIFRSIGVPIEAIEKSVVGLIY